LRRSRSARTVSSLARSTPGASLVFRERAFRTLPRWRARAVLLHACVYPPFECESRAERFAARYAPSAACTLAPKSHLPCQIVRAWGQTLTIHPARAFAELRARTARR
jgi:hypothetical protein